MDIARDQQKWIKEAGFVNVKEDMYKVTCATSNQKIE